MNESKIKKKMNLAEMNFKKKEYQSAEKDLNEILLHQSNNSKANELLAYIHGNRGNTNLALALLKNACKEKDCSAEAHYYYGIMLLSQSLYIEAINSLECAIEKAGPFFEAMHELGTAHACLGQNELALKYYLKCLQEKDDLHQLNYNIAQINEKLGNHELASQFYSKAISLKPDYVEAWINKGTMLMELQRYDDAISNFDAAISIKKDCSAYFNKGNALYELKKYDEALLCYERAINIKPNYLEAWTHRGLAYQHYGQKDEAIACYEKAISLSPLSMEPLINRGYLYEKTREFKKAINDFEKILSIDSNRSWIYGDALHAKLKICLWDKFNINKKYIEDNENIKSINPFKMLSICNNPSLIKKFTETYVDEKFYSKEKIKPILKNERNEKIRIGYFSCDFRNHAVSILIAGLFEMHNKDKFEIYGFSYGEDDESPIRQRLIRSFTKFFDVKYLSEREITKLSRNLKIDIAIDLGGLTGDSRTKIFSYRAAPLQVNYLGYPGTMGANYIDYIIADKTIIPTESQKHYTEKVVYLPHSYQVNDRNRKISDRNFTRAELELPEKGFIFCSFNNSYKILPETFEVWMRILRNLDHSVLWLLEDNAIASKNLRAEAKKRGIDPSRLVFAARLPSADHLARHAHANLFLDTFPYNAHTTASDALWAGLPLITLQGQSFASRVAASLLSAIGLPELITKTPEEYEKLAINLAKNPQKLLEIKEKLSKNRDTAPLFDTPQFTRYLENAYLQMYEQFQADLPVDHIYVD
jgi:predicted O-linked N-acetylglucosamine transferase (SPINDLY family)